MTKPGKINYANCQINLQNVHRFAWFCVTSPANPYVLCSYMLHTVWFLCVITVSLLLKMNSIFTVQRSYASVVLGITILSIHPSIHHTFA